MTKKRYVKIKGENTMMALIVFFIVGTIFVNFIGQANIQSNADVNIQITNGNLLNSESFEFIDKFDEIVAEELEEDVGGQFTEIDSELQLKELVPDMVVALSKLEPFGISNSEPNFLARNVKILKQNIINRSHLHWKLGAKNTNMTFNAIAFGLLNHRNAPVVGDLIDIIYFPRINVYGEGINMQLYIKDFVHSGSSNR